MKAFNCKSIDEEMINQEECSLICSRQELCGSHLETINGLFAKTKYLNRRNEIFNNHP